MSAGGQSTAPDVLLLIAPGCPHCAAVLEALSGLVKEAVVARLEIVNIAARPEQAQGLGVRSVPWTRMGPFELEGLRGPEELRRWAELANSPGGMAAYLDELLKTGQLRRVEDMVRAQPAHLGALVGLLGGPETGINTRIGVMAVLEELEGSGLTASVVTQLGLLTEHRDTRIRTDACHALSLTGSAEALPYLYARREDPEPEVREAVQEAIDSLSGD